MKWNARTEYINWRYNAGERESSSSVDLSYLLENIYMDAVDRNLINKNRLSKVIDQEEYVKRLDTEIDIDSETDYESELETIVFWVKKFIWSVQNRRGYLRQSLNSNLFLRGRESG